MAKQAPLKPRPPSFGVGRQAAQDRVDEWIAAVAPGRSFIDIGGIGEHGANERCSWAHRCGARDVTMADILPLDHDLWGHYGWATRTHGLSEMEFRYEIDVDDPLLAKKLGRFDIVHSAGLLYHLPNPVHTLLNLRRVTAEYLITNTVVIPDVVENAEGRVAFPAAATLFLPALRGRERAVLRRHYLDRFQLDLDVYAPMQGRAMPYLSKGVPNLGPYWWLFTKSAFEHVLEMMDLRILDRHTWQGHAHFVFLRKR